MPLILPGNVASATASTTYDVDNSCRFNKADTPSMTKDNGTPSSETTGTISFWTKRCILSVGDEFVLDGRIDANNRFKFAFNSSDIMEFWNSNGGSDDLNLNSNRKFRDVSAWYHFVIRIDTTQSTAADRVRVYVNGVNEADVGGYSTETYPDEDSTDTVFFENSAKQTVGAYYNGSAFTYPYDGYLAEVVYCDGQSYAPTEFGEFDSDSPTIWKPKNVSGLTFGNNGFYLDFGNSADLGADVSGNSNDFTSANLDATDQATDTPTNNFCTMNPLDNYLAGHTLSEGNLKVVSTASDWTGTLTATMGMSAGKWYWELFADTDSAVALYGIKSGVSHDDSNYLTETTSIGDIGYGIVTTSGNMGYPSGSSNSYGSALDADDVLMFALDMDNLQFYIGINGTWGNSGDPAGNSNGWTVTAPPSGFYFPGVTFNSSETIYFNFGSPPTGFTISSGNADGDGYGNFEYAPPSGFYALCTKNLGAYGG